MVAKPRNQNTGSQLMTQCCCYCYHFSIVIFHYFKNSLPLSGICSTRVLVFPEKITFQVGCELWAGLTRQGTARVWLGLSVQYLLPGMRWLSRLETEASRGLCLGYQQLELLPSPCHPSQMDKVAAVPIILPVRALTSNLLASSYFSLTLPLLLSFPSERLEILLHRKPTTLCHHVSHLTHASWSLATFKGTAVNLSSAGCWFSDIRWTTRRHWEAEWRRWVSLLPGYS